ncbi:potassium channel family protein [Sodalis sp. RH19]|uniref:potassium channel family protein n=1 Tax=Sodalis sp. RH19 TaxID=3394334 RepID=UPI0039B3F210
MNDIIKKQEKNIKNDNLIKLSKPHLKNSLATKLGKITEKSSYLDMFLTAIFIIILCAVFFWLAPEGLGLKENRGFLDGLYFCFITFTTVGYGDLLPVGLGRIISIILAMNGLVITALLIGKFASERQQAILLLFHTSKPPQVRMANFLLKGLLDN